jgi:hypothetical protein
MAAGLSSPGATISAPPATTRGARRSCHPGGRLRRLLLQQEGRGRPVIAISRSRPAPPPGLACSWDGALLGPAYALPAAIVATGDRARGIALSVGVLPGAIIGLAPRRRGRLMVVVLGALTAVPMLIGGLLAGVPVLAVAAIGALGVGPALLAARAPVGRVAMVARSS